ncbi:MAG: RNA methyltransferase [Candidatus Anstonellales archaeon]
MRLVLVEPEYDMNVGAVCRVMKNFGFSELYLVRPACPMGFNARMFAKHATDILERARIVGTIDEALEGFVIATSGIRRRNSILLKDFAPPKSPYTLIFGREGEGLHSDELAKADALVHIETSPAYPSLNVVNAVAITLFHISSFPPAPKHQLYEKKLSALVSLAEELGGKELSKAMRSIIVRSSPTEKELNAMLRFFSSSKHKRLTQ